MSSDPLSVPPPTRQEEAARCQPCTRRTLLQGLGLLALGALSLDAPACGDSSSNLPQAVPTACGNDLCIDLTNPQNAALTQPDGYLLVERPDQQDILIVIRTSTTSVLALSAICTHQGCLVGFNSSQQVVACPCHGSVFSESGQVLQGPARAALRSYPAVLSGNTITVTLG